MTIAGLMRLNALAVPITQNCWEPFRLRQPVAQGCWSVMGVAIYKTALASGALRLMKEYQLSSAHINFLPEHDAKLLANDGWLHRTGIQFHWHNQNFADFDAFLASLSSRKRKNIRKERASIAASGITLLPLTGDTITKDHIDDFYRFYMSTIDRKWGGLISPMKYLTNFTGRWPIKCF